LTRDAERTFPVLFLLVTFLLGGTCLRDLSPGEIDAGGLVLYRPTKKLARQKPATLANTRQCHQASKDDAQQGRTHSHSHTIERASVVTAPTNANNWCGGPGGTTGICQRQMCQCLPVGASGRRSPSLELVARGICGEPCGITGALPSRRLHAGPAVSNTGCIDYKVAPRTGYLSDEAGAPT
jgi:hypothetical protein